MIMRQLFILLFIVALITGQGFCFDDEKTHPEITDNAINASNLQTYLVNYLGFPSGYKSNIYGPSRRNLFQYQTIMKWLQTGSTDEDALSMCRASNHFHNPIHSGDWTQSQMSDSEDVDLVCGTANRYSNVTWATGFIFPAPGGNKITPNGQSNGWDNARQYYYNALTTTDTYSNSSGTSKENLFALTFRSLGMVMHLLQDMAVPAHVRNDMTSHLFDSRTWLRRTSNPFEKYVKTNNRALSNAPIIPILSPITKLTDFWDTNFYNGIEPDITRYAGIGLAEYTNANFLSDFTIFDQNPTAVHYFPYPSSSSVSTGTKQIANPFMPGTTVPRQYYVKTSDGEVGYLLAGVGYLDVKAPGIIGNTTKKIPPMDNNVHSDYAQLLLPRAVGYSAALLDYFLRGKIEVEPVITASTLQHIRVKVKNVTDRSEEMTGGVLALAIKYRISSESADHTIIPPSETSPYYYKVVQLSGQYTIPRDSQSEQVFDLGSDPLPLFATDVTLQVIYRGQLGNEAGSVAVGTAKFDKYTTDIALSLPASGVYATAAPNATGFNRIAVTAYSLSDLAQPDGLFELVLKYRIATSDPFQGVPVDSVPADNGSFSVIRANEGNGVNTLQRGEIKELVFNLATPLPLWATDVYLDVVYRRSGVPDEKPLAMGQLDISEPTPVDVFNNADKVCINHRWYTAGSPEAVALADSNGNGYPDLFDPYAHNIANIYSKESSSSNATPASATNFTFQSPPVLTGGSFRRLGYILTDYSFKYSLTEDWIDVSPDVDPWETIGIDGVNPGTAVKNQTDADGTYTYSPMFNMRGSKMWWGASYIYVNTEDEDTECGWNNL
jgi:hypothetical protein